jgi:hypothetical protein
MAQGLTTPGHSFLLASSVVGLAFCVHFEKNHEGHAGVRLTVTGEKLHSRKTGLLWCFGRKVSTRKPTNGVTSISALDEAHPWDSISFDQNKRQRRYCGDKRMNNKLKRRRGTSSPPGGLIETLGLFALIFAEASEKSKTRN